MKRYFLAGLTIACLLAGSFQLRAQDPVYDAYYFSITREYTLNADGSTDFRYVKDQKLLTYRAFHNLYGETFIVYDPVVQKLKINEAFTTMADGKKVTAPANAFNEVLPSFAAGAPSFNALREMVVTHTGLERDATVHLDYQVHTEKGVVTELMGNELLAEPEPVKSLVIRVRIPADRNLYYKVFNGDYPPETSTEGSFRVYTWKLAEIPAMSAEENQPGTNDRYPRLIFSTSENPDEVYAFLSGQPAFGAALPEEVKRSVNTWVADRTDKFDKALKLQEKVVSDLRLYPVPLRAARYTCRTPGETWNDNGGTPVEKAVLLAAMMKSAGIDAQPCAVVRTAFADNKVGTLADIEDFAVKAEFRDKGTWYFSVTALNQVNLKLSLAGRSFVALKPGAKITVEKAESPKQMVKVIGNLLVSSDPRLTGEVSIYLEGGVYPAAGMMRDKKRIKNALTGNLIGSDTASLKISTLNPENGFQSWIVRNDKPFRKDSNYYFFTLPYMSSGIESWNIKTLSQKRSAPYEIPSAADESYSWTIALPSGLACFTPEKKLNISNRAGSFTWEVKKDGGKLTVKRQIRFSNRVFSPAEYADFKVLMDCWNNPWYRQMVIKSD